MSIKDLNKFVLKELLAKELPGEVAQARMAPEHRELKSSDPNCLQAAVLLLLFPGEEAPSILFMKRNEYDGPHSGQISLPGGMVEAGDRDFIDTALREANEETGIISQDVEILGLLSTLYIPVSNFCVQPVVGWLDYKPEFNPDPSEVQYLLTASVLEFTKEKNKKKDLVQTRSGNLQVPVYAIASEKIWGATAMIISEFMALFDS